AGETIRSWIATRTEGQQARLLYGGPEFGSACEPPGRTVGSSGRAQTPWRALSRSIMTFRSLYRISACARRSDRWASAKTPVKAACALMARRATIAASPDKGVIPSGLPLHG